MLLNEAIRSAGFIKFLFKIIALTYLKLIIKENIKFISITNQETQAIKKYFPNSFVEEISNPIPFKFDENKNYSLIPKIIKWYTRPNTPHKNLHLLIKSFISANLPEKWNLKFMELEMMKNILNFLKS